MRSALAVLLVLAPLTAQQDRQSALDEGRSAMAARDYATAASKFAAAAAAAEEANSPALLESLRGHATASRMLGRLEEAETTLKRAVGVLARAGRESTLDNASLLSELALVQRAAGRPGEAIATLESAIRVREQSAAAPEDLAKDLTALGLLRSATNEPKLARETLTLAVATWDKSPGSDGPHALIAVEALADIHRDAAEYTAAEVLYVRSLKAREAALGPNASELLATLDSLAYSHFGLKRYSEAEPVYKRLLALWESSAGPDHPMVALTLEKMAEFYSAQQRYGEAEPLLARSLDIRTRTLLASMNQQGRVLLMQAKLSEAEELYTRAVRIGDDCGVADEFMDPLLRVYAKILREMKQTPQADALEKRVKAALLRKADREGRRSPPSLPRK
jgi:tetratricopeptide (TPR) repeat protein